MTDRIHRPTIRDWLENYLTHLKLPKSLSQSFLEGVGNEALAAKVADIENYNLAVASRLRKRLPERLTNNEIAAVMVHIFEFRMISTSQNTKDGMLGLYIPTDTDIWLKHKKARGTYTTDSVFFYYLLTKISPETTSARDEDEIYKVLRAHVPVVDVTADPHLFPVNNGIYNQRTKELEAFSPERVYLTKIGIDYIQTVQNPIVFDTDGTTWDVDSWLDELSVTPEVNQLLWQVIAASLQPNRGMNKSIWFYSESGNNGKGTVGQLIKNLLGPGNYSSLAVSDFNHEFLKADLLGVAANISDENDVEQYIDSVKDYKASVTGDDIMVNRKHKDPVRLQFRGLNIQMMNGLPKTRDKTGSFYRRLIIVPFIKSFTNNGEKGYIKTDYINRKAVLEYVLHKALALEFDEFLVPQASAYLLEQYKEKNNPVLDFWREIREELKWDLVPKHFLYDLYQKWFERSNPSGTVIGQRTFFDNMSPVIDLDGDWANHMGNEKSNIRVGKYMDADEPLITEYGLDRPYRNGSPSPWGNNAYTGANAQKKRDFVRKTKYRGIVRN